MGEIPRKEESLFQIDVAIDMVAKAINLRDSKDTFGRVMRRQLLARILPR
jgi:hypothetical protein